MLVKEFIEILKTLPQDYEIKFGNEFLMNKINTSKYDLNGYDLEHQGSKSDKHLTIWNPE